MGDKHHKIDLKIVDMLKTVIIHVCGLCFLTYIDNKGGAACCSGDGDELLKYCPSHSVVTFMKQV